MEFCDSFEMLVNPVIELKEAIDEGYGELNGFIQLILLVPYFGFVFVWITIFAMWHAVSIPLAMFISIITFPFD